MINNRFMIKILQCYLLKYTINNVFIKSKAIPNYIESIIFIKTILWYNTIKRHYNTYISSKKGHKQTM